MKTPFLVALVTVTAASLVACSSIRVDPYLPAIHWQSAPAPTQPTPPVEPAGSEEI